MSLLYLNKFLPVTNVFLLFLLEPHQLQNPDALDLKNAFILLQF